MSKISGFEYKFFKIKLLCVNSKAQERKKSKCALIVTMGLLDISYTIEAGQRR